MQHAIQNAAWDLTSLKEKKWRSTIMSRFGKMCFEKKYLENLWTFGTDSMFLSIKTPMVAEPTPPQLLSKGGSPSSPWSVEVSWLVGKLRGG
jgi:hypothetical protein